MLEWAQTAIIKLNGGSSGSYKVDLIHQSWGLSVVLLTIIYAATRGLSSSLKEISRKLEKQGGMDHVHSSGFDFLFHSQQKHIY